MSSVLTIRELNRLASLGCWQEILDHSLSTSEWLSMTDEFGVTALHVLVRYGTSVGIVESLIKAGADANAEDHSGVRPLAIAISNDQPLGVTTIPVIQILLDLGASLTDAVECGQPPLHWAVMTNNEGVVSYLLQRGCSLKHKNIYGETPIDVAKHYQLSKMLALLNREIVT
jgi:uncharacterized protein